MKIFIGSSSEAAKRDVMANLAYWLEDLGHAPIRWDDPGVFLPGQNVFTRLIEIGREVDAAILMFSEDDEVWYKHGPVKQPRDNVLLEYGLFSAALGPTKVIVGREGRAKNPSDLAGIVYLDLSPEKLNWARAQLKRWIISISPKDDLPPTNNGLNDESLTPEEELALGLTLSDPRAGDRGAWVYPLHQDLGYRGLSEVNATAALNSLVQKGMLKAVDVEANDPLTGEASSAPAYQATPRAFAYAQSSEWLRSFKPKYRYIVRLYGAEGLNQTFLEHLRELEYVERQTRFIIEEDPGYSKIGVFCYQSITQDEMNKMARSFNVTIDKFSEGL